jgi:hypothetical protein
MTVTSGWAGMMERRMSRATHKNEAAHFRQARFYKKSRRSLMVHVACLPTTLQAQNTLGKHDHRT